MTDVERIRKEVEAIEDKKGMPVDPKIKELVIGLRYWGVKIVMSCEGHRKRGLPYPWVRFKYESMEKLVKALYWQYLSKNQIKWVIKIKGMPMLIPEDKKEFTLKELQEGAVAFGKLLQKQPESKFDKPFSKLFKET